MDYYKDYQELFKGAVLWFTGYNQTNLGFPILPSGVTVTPNGTWTNDLSLGNNKTLKTFNGSTNYISLTDNAAWDFHNGSITVCLWWKPINRIYRHIFGSQYQSASPLNVNAIYYYPAGNSIYLQRCIAGTYDGSWYCVSSIVEEIGIM